MSEGCDVSGIKNHSLGTSVLCIIIDLNDIVFVISIICIGLVDEMIILISAISLCADVLPNSLLDSDKF